MWSPRAARFAATLVLVALAFSAAAAQRGGDFYTPRSFTVPYNGKLTFTRVRYSGGGGGFGRGGSNAWNHDYPRADQHLPMILDAITSLKPNLDVSNILDLEDPEIGINFAIYALTH